MITYKKKCSRCNKVYVKATNRTRFVVCFDCQKHELEGDIKDPQMQKLFDIPFELYQESAFLRDIKIKYLRFGSLTEKQIEAFSKTVNDITKQKEEAQKEQTN